MTEATYDHYNIWIYRYTKEPLPIKLAVKDRLTDLVLQVARFSPAIDRTLKTRGFESIHGYRFSNPTTLDDLDSRNVAIDDFLDANPDIFSTALGRDQLGVPQNPNCLDFVLKIVEVAASQDDNDEESDLLPELFAKRFNQMRERVKKSKVPSEGSKSAGYKKDQGKYSILDGRYDGDKPGADNVGPPIEIFHPCFEEFRHNLESVEVPDDSMDATIDFIRLSSGVYDSESTRSRMTQEPLRKATGISFIRVVNSDKTAPESVNLHEYLNRNVLLCLREDKHEIGAGGSAPDVQASLSVRRWWFQVENEELANVSNCPCFILAMAGPYFMILGAILGQDLIVQPLTPYIRAAEVPQNEEHYRYVARALYALGIGVHSLKKYWDNLPCPATGLNEPSPSRFNPWCNFYPHPDNSANMVQFEYLHALEKDVSTVTFLGRLIEPQATKIVVKFTEAGHYGRDAHTLLESAGYAPKLLYAGELTKGSRLWMIVMEYIEGETLLSCRSPPIDFKEQVEKALNVLHTKNFVFGDLRRQNIMIDEGRKVKLIDFDWAGEEGVSKYRMRMNPQSDLWVDGMGRLKVMLKEHDRGMLKKL